MAVSTVAWLIERSPVLLGAAAAVNLASAVVLALDEAWPFVAIFLAGALLFGLAALREARKRTRRQS